VSRTGKPAPYRFADEPMRYRLISELGHGSMGTVWLAYDIRRQQDVALKRLIAPSATGILRLKREFRVIAPLRHPHLVRLYDLWDDGGGPFFTMEFIDGQDLRVVLTDHVSSRPPPDRIRFALDFATQILPALEFLHAHGVIHRDLKPSNLMLSIEGVFKLLDFGILVSLDEREASSFDRRGAGTPPYLAPEQARGEPPTPASDMYSFGVVLAEMMLGGLVARGCTPGAAIHSDRDRIRRELPRDLAHLCEALLDEDSHLRPDARATLGALIRPNAPPPPSVDRENEASHDFSPDPDDNHDPDPNFDLSPDHNHDPDPNFDLSPDPVHDLSPDPEVTDWLAPRLEEVADGTFDMAVVEGDGHARVIRWARDVARNAGGLVLVGGDQPDEHVRYNVLDSAIDALAAVLLETLSDAELARDLALASTEFPVLAGKRASGERVSRSRAFDALIRILASLAGAGGVYLVIDDLQKADAPSLAFLDRLLERRPSGVALVATLDPGAETSAARHWLDAQRRMAREPLARATVWSFHAGSSPRTGRGGHGDVGGGPGHVAARSTRARRQLAKPENAGELGQGGRDIPAIGAKRHGEPIGDLLLRGGRLDEREVDHATLPLATRGRFSQRVER
jgi:serine/threonine protein kinase